MTATRRLRHLGWPCHPFLSIRVTEDIKNNTKRIIAITIPYQQNIKEEFKEKYKKMMVDVAEMLGAQRYRAEIEMKKTLNFMIEFREVLVLDKNINTSILVI